MASVTPQNVAQQLRGDNVDDTVAAAIAPRGTNVPSTGDKLGAASRVLGTTTNMLAARVLGGDGGRGMLPQQQGRSYYASDEKVLRDQILDTHGIDTRLFAVRPVLRIIQISLLKTDVADENALPVGSKDMVELPTRVLTAIASEILCKTMSGDGDIHNTTMEILKIVKHYNWDAKAVLALGSLAVNYGEFQLAASLQNTNPLAKSVALLRQLPEILENSSGSLKPKLETLDNLVKAMVDAANVVFEFYELQRHKFFNPEAPETVAFLILIPTAVYWVVRSTVISSSQILSLTSMGQDYMSEAWELSSMAHKLRTIQSHLLDQLDGCNKYLENKENEEAFNLISSILETSHLDSSKPLRALFYAKDDLPALYDGHAKRRASIDELRKKVVVLFISRLEIPQEDYTIIHQMYQEKRLYPLKNESQYEMVWVPVEENWTPTMLERFERLKDEMDWYTVHHPSVVSPVVAKYIKHPQKWKFEKKPIFVVMDTQGKVVHKNAMHMMCIWGSVAYPFSETKEKFLWEEENWRMGLIADNIDPRLSTWIQSEKIVCLFGGEDIDWIRKFTRAIKDAARNSNILIELMYVGKSKPKERIVNEINAIIETEKLASTLEWNYIWYFWLRIESMWYSKGQLSAAKSESMKNDPIMLGIIALLSFGSGTQGWALVSRGSMEMAKGNGELAYKAVLEHGHWRPRENAIGFVPAFDEYIGVLRQKAPHHCTSLVLPAVGAMPETVACAECGRLMERFTMFRCCAD